ncbi:hypothetical protein Lmor_1255 [Legionella moravica]|uniref:Uncharacterized protein n=1 Tax=Legionella moravica TaxID=39962 RepID=A0A378JWA2_9GAMM|nr:hypothetical protein [Legionella moravica]KTD34722.1 hypothetical protein Lmor_1255 [Legionella moravica]STX61329.1 Uncharacterised protein [Legionella moravica]
MPNFLPNEGFNKLKHSLPHEFRNQLINEEAVLAQAYPLLNMLCPNRDELNELSIRLNIPEPLNSKDLARRLASLTLELEGNFNVNALFQYRLPIVLSEFPKHSRVINQTIQKFNDIIEAYHRNEIEELSETNIEEHYKAILSAIKEQGFYRDSDSFWQLNCDNESLWQLIGMLAGWSKTSPVDVMNRENIPLAASSSEPVVPSSSIEPIRTPVEIADLPQDAKSSIKSPFIPEYSYNFNGAGRLDTETNFLLLNAFGMKFGGHFDAQVKYPPRFIPLDQLHVLVRRQLSHRMDVWSTPSFQLWLETTLAQLGVEFIQKNKNDSSEDLLVNPFLKEPISFLSPEKINTVLNQTLLHFTDEEFNPSASEIAILSQYLFELLQGFQVNPGLALGIGANWDGTVNLSNEAGAYAFKFRESKADWGRRFKHLSLHRQGPSEAKMNAAIGVQFELQSLMTDFDYMSQLQPSEYNEVVYNALIDNLVTDLLPEPSYFENERYPKYKKQHVVKTNESGLIEIDSFLIPSKQGTYFKGRNGEEKQTPMYRRAGTLDVQAFPKNTTYCEQSKVCYAGNPLGPLQMQFAQSMYRNVRGHIVYDPIAPDQFLEDAYYGQVIRGDNDDYLPFIGVIPKNFDRYFNQPNELCASFVVRMLQSARMMEYCPTFKTAYDLIKTRFLPGPQKQPPALPQFCSDYLAEKHQQLISALANNERNFSECQKILFSLVKNLIYSLYDIGRDDQQFKQGYLAFIHSKDTFSPINRAKCDKLIRELTVTKPVEVSPEAMSRYEQILGFLRDITSYFYPQPSEELAQELARQARLHVNPLLKTKAITAYFDNLKRSKQDNLSRKQTPGMLYAALKHGGPSKTVARDYGQMHDYNFPSYYRDPDGTPQGEPQTHDRFIDWSAKRLGAGLQIMHKYHLFAFIHNPIYETFNRARQSAAAHRHDPLKALWALKGALEGLFWHGIVIGLWQTTTTPVHMLCDFFSWQLTLFNRKSIKSIENPLTLPAAPANELNTKSKASAESRDYLLSLLGKSKPLDAKKNSVIAYARTMIHVLYPHLRPVDLTVCNQQLLNDFPLTEEEWNSFFAPVLNPSEDHELSTLLHRYNGVINNNLIQAVYQCITNPRFSAQPKPVCKQIISSCSLNAKQSDVLNHIATLYQHTPLENKLNFIQLFQFSGAIQKALQRRDQFIQKVQNFILNVFDEQWILTLLFNHHLEQLIAKLTPLTLEQTILIMPDTIKWPLHHLLTANNTHVLDDYILNENQKTLLMNIHSMASLIKEPEHIKQLLSHCRVDQRCKEHGSSIKEKAHNKWAKFAERELKHQLLSDDEVHDIISLLADKLSAFHDLNAPLNRLPTVYQSLNTNEGLDLFYETSTAIKIRLEHYLHLNDKAHKSKVTEAKTLLKNFLNMSMNAAINSRLDQVDVFAQEKIQNPLLMSNAIGQWLSGLQKNNYYLRSFLEQQLHQAPSLDHTLWRCKCIFQVLEQKQPAERIKNTGMQSLLRFWSQHKDNVTMTGEHYINPEFSKPNKCAHTNLFDDSVTLRHAITRVREKLPNTSLFNMPRKIAIDENNEIELIVEP